MQQDLVKIKCPTCGAVLKVRQSDIVRASASKATVTCAVCQQKQMLADYLLVEESPASPMPIAPMPPITPPSPISPPPSPISPPPAVPRPDDCGATVLAGSGMAAGAVRVNPAGGTTAGRLRLLPAGPVYSLKEGRNVVGRMAAAAPHADIEIAVASKRLSRQHIIISVEQVPGKGTVHYVSLCKELTNATFVDNVPLVYGDTVVLKAGDVLKLPDADLLFEL